MQNIGGVILAVKNGSTRRKVCHHFPLSTTNFACKGLGSNRSIGDENRGTSILFGLYTKVTADNAQERPDIIAQQV
jgi:hypothetical protein